MSLVSSAIAVVTGKKNTLANQVDRALSIADRALQTVKSEYGFDYRGTVIEFLFKKMLVMAYTGEDIQDSFTEEEAELARNLAAAGPDAVFFSEDGGRFTLVSSFARVPYDMNSAEDLSGIMLRMHAILGGIPQTLDTDVSSKALVDAMTPAIDEIDDRPLISYRQDS